MKELSKAYIPADHEAKIYAQWEKSGAFKPDGNAHLRAKHSGDAVVGAPAARSANEDSGVTQVAGPDSHAPFSIIMPPPNANGNLHTGHAMFTVEDILTRYHRMKGDPTLWLPGTDHAGIETQIVFERELAKEGKSRFDFSPAEFYQLALEYTKGNQGNIIAQLKSLGFSADWSRLKFTLDEDVIETVYDTFKRLHDDGQIYRGNRIVNWCPHCNSSFADIEIKYREQLDPLYFIKYGPFVLATVRPETKFGDTAIAVHPNDERYAAYIGQEIEAEGLLGSFKLKVIGDTYVNPDFGTGVVKVTPAHDPNDWEMGLRHMLEVKSVIGTDGRLTSIAGKYAGMPVADARVAVVADLEAAGLMDHVDMNYSHSVGYHDRCGTQIEPVVTEQWWLKVAELKKPAIKAVKDGDIKIVPARFEKVYTDWLEGLRDWNISRQNWFGIRIPVYYRSGGDESKEVYLITADEREAKAYYGEGNYEAETDTFDTWFSSSQWPFATLKNTGHPSDFEHFYPTSVMETGRDILFQWVTRMVMLGLYRYPDKVPFKTIYLHGLVNDAHGKKMSKSKGNVINPLDFTAKYGSDALRLALTIGITPGNDGSLSEAKVEGYRNFCNKLWNVARFILGQLPEGYSPSEPSLHSPADHWIKFQLDEATSFVTEAIESYRFSEAGQVAYVLLWSDFADWYIEASKVSPNHDLLVYALENILKLLHPIAPFVTEAIWSHLPWQDEQLIVSGWPNVSRTKKTVEASQFERVIEAVNAIRSISAEEQLAKPAIITDNSDLIRSSELIQRLARTGEIRLYEQGSGLYVSPGVWIEADAELINARRHHLDAQRAEKQKFLANLDARLANTQYVESAPEAVVQETRDTRDETLMLLSKLDEQIKALDQ